MIRPKNALVIDQGNTLTKIAVFTAQKLIHKNTLPTFDPIIWNSLMEKYQPYSVLFASVSKAAPSWLKHDKSTELIVLDSQTPLPFKSQYETMETLGVDRIANVAAVVAKKKYPALIIDAGSCITYEVIDDQGVFLGGAISPGMVMRMKSMHTFTGKLPLLDTIDIDPPLIGPSTKASMMSGIIHGIKGEMQRYTSKLTHKYSDLTIFLTGGDMSFFDLETKNDIFAHPELTLTGLYKILELNAKG